MTEAQPKTAEELGAALNPKHRQFADTYLTNNLNARAAARACGYKNPEEGKRIKRRPEVDAYIQARLQEALRSTDTINARLEYFAASDMQNFLRIAPSERSYWVRADQHEELREFAKRRGVNVDALDNYDISGFVGSENVALTEDGVLMVCIRKVDAEATIDWRQAEELGVLGHVKKLKVGKDGSVEFELHDPIRANELLGKANKMFVDRVEMSGNGGGPVQVQITRRIVSANSIGGKE